MEEQDIECQYVTTPLSRTRPIDEKAEIDFTIIILPDIVNVKIIIHFATHNCILYSPGPVLAVLVHRIVIWSHPLKNGLIQHTSKINFVFLDSH